jgi:hypothetical protein
MQCSSHLHSSRICNNRTFQLALLFILAPYCAHALSGVATLTYYHSYAPCCPDEVNYDPSADTTECDLYDACSWTGHFAALPGKQSFEFVANSSLIAFYEYGDNSFENFYNNYAGENVTLVKDGNIVFEALIADSCGDTDCNGCCSSNSEETGYLVDLEYFTMLRNFDDPADASGYIEFYIGENYVPSSNDTDSLWWILLVGALVVCVGGGIVAGVWCYARGYIHHYVSSRGEKAKKWEALPMKPLSPPLSPPPPPLVSTPVSVSVPVPGSSVTCKDACDSTISSRVHENNTVNNNKDNNDDSGNKDKDLGKNSTSTSTSTSSSRRNKDKMSRNHKKKLPPPSSASSSLEHLCAEKRNG